MTKILGKSVATSEQMATYLLIHNPNPLFSRTISVKDFCQLFIDICAKEGVRGDIAFAQAYKETGIFKFKGDVKYTQNNFAGLGATGNGVCGCNFKDIETGILAQAQHLKTYATKLTLNETCVDPRRTTWFVDAKGGTSPDVETLGGTWAVPGYDTKKYSSLAQANTAKDSYGYQIINILNEILKINVKEEENIVTKINSDLEIRQCFLVNNDCYKQGIRMKPSGIVVHSTGANNPYLKRYIQPNDGILGVNPYNNHWNKAKVYKCVHAFIGKDVNGKVRVYQTLPWDYCCWGCASGKNGTYNNRYIQFEICEDALTDANYFTQAFNLAIELCAYLVKEYNISIENIVSHNEAHKRGYASGHIDCDHWLKKHGKNMDWFRGQVSTEIGNVVVTPTTSSTPSYDLYTVKSGDTLSKIGSKFGIPWKTIANLNGIKTPYIVRTGQVLKLRENIVPTTTTSSTVVIKGDYSLIFNATYYANKYPDLKAAFGANTTQLLSHFKTYGMKEGRQAIASFNVQAYKNKNADLRKAFGNAGYEKYFEHYLIYGYKENRKCV